MPDAPDSGTIPQDDSIDRDLKRRVRRAEREQDRRREAAAAAAEDGVDYVGPDPDEPVASIMGDDHGRLCAERGINLDSSTWPENQETEEEEETEEETEELELTETPTEPNLFAPNPTP